MKKILMIIILTALIVLGVAVSSFAADPIIIGGGTTNITDPNSTVNETGNNTVISPTTNTTSTYTNKTNTTTIPQTGDNDFYVVSALVLVCGVAAIYAYKKIRDYKD